MKKFLVLHFALCLAVAYLAACSSGYDPAHDTDRPSSGEEIEEIEETPGLLLNVTLPSPPPPMNRGGIEDGYYFGRKLIEFGDYEWFILEERDGEALVLMFDAFDKMQYHDEDGNITWEDCSLRAYLNGEFYDSFSEEDRARIIETHLVNSSNHEHFPYSQNDTLDHIFLLNSEEAYIYFDGRWGVYVTRISYDGSENEVPLGREFLLSPWWLRSPGLYKYQAAVMLHGRVWVGGPKVTESRDVRPAMWITLE